VKVVYVAHQLSAPTRERIDANRARASRWCAWVATAYGFAPEATWIVLTGVLDDNDPETRALGLALDLALVARCDEVWLVGGRVSSGMNAEATEAVRLGKPVLDLTGLGDEPPPEAIPLEQLGTLWWALPRDVADEGAS
jgi:hypothetical protein